MINVFWISLAALLVLVNGFFVAAEFGMVKLRPTRIREIAETKGTRGRILAKVHAKVDAYLSACQLGITLASLGLGWIGEPAFADLLEPVFARLGLLQPEIIQAVAFAVAFSVISFLHIVAGELAPKSLALRNPEAIALWSAIPLYCFYWLMYPAIWTLNTSANLILRLMRLRLSQPHETHYSAEELKLILRTNRSSGRFTRDEWNIMAKTLDFSELEVADLMRPVHEVVALHRSQTLQENMQTVHQYRFSRYPYFDTNKIDVLGIIHLKDLFLAQQEGKTFQNLEGFLRPIKYVPVNTSALHLLRHFRTGASHFTMIGKKGKKPQGFITLDNLLSALVGDIKDEFRQSSNDWIRLDDGAVLCKGSLPIFTLERILGIDIENEELELEDEVSVGGLIMSKLCDIPAEEQEIEFNQFEVVIKKMDGPRIALVQIFSAESPEP